MTSEGDTQRVCVMTSEGDTQGEYMLEGERVYVMTSESDNH